MALIFPNSSREKSGGGVYSVTDSSSVVVFAEFGTSTSSSCKVNKNLIKFSISREVFKSLENYMMVLPFFSI